MILSFVLFCGSFLVDIIITPLKFFGDKLSAISVVDSMTTWLITALLYFGGIINIPALFAALTFLINFYVWFYMMKILFWILQRIPFLGKYVSNPFHYTGTGFLKNQNDNFAERHGYYPQSGGKPYTENVDASKWYKR